MTHTEVSLPRAAPATVGVAPSTIAGFLDSAAAAGLELHSVMVFCRGSVIAEGWWAPYRPVLPHMQHSLAKSFTATAVGLAIAEGHFGLDDPVTGFFPGEAPAHPGPHLAAMTVRHLLTMTTGHANGIAGDTWRQVRTSWVAEFFRAPVPEPPGQRFVYSSASSYMLSVIVQRSTGQTLFDYLTQRLFAPLGIVGATWDLCPNGINPGGNGLSCRTEDLLKLAVLYLQDGRWNGRQLLPAGWAAAATRHLVDVPASSGARHLNPEHPTPRGYGYQWWTGPAGAAYAAGLFGQYAIVLPEQSAAIAVTAALHQDDRRLLDLVWRDLVPALAEGDTLDRRLQSLRLTLPDPGPASPMAATISGQSFRMDPNADGVEVILLDFAAGECTFHLRDRRGRHQVRVGTTGWVEAETTMTGNELHHQYQPALMRVSALGTWSDEQTFTMTWQFIETAFRDQVVLRFEGNAVTLDHCVNVNSGTTARPTITGHR